VSEKEVPQISHDEDVLFVVRTLLCGGVDRKWRQPICFPSRAL